MKSCTKESCVQFTTMWSNRSTCVRAIWMVTTMGRWYLPGILYLYKKNHAYTKNLCRTSLDSWQAGPRKVKCILGEWHKTQACGFWQNGCELHTFRCLQWDSPRCREVMRASCYPFNMPKRRFHNMNPRVYHNLLYHRDPIFILIYIMVINSCPWHMPCLQDTVLTES